MVVNETERPGWIERIEKMKNARYVGYYDLPGRYQEYGAFYVFYQDEIPVEFQGDPRYDNYFAILLRYHDVENLGSPTVYITGAKGIREAKFSAYEYEPGKFIVSRYRHDYVTTPDGSNFLDGGLSCCRYSKPPTHYMTVEEGKEVFHAIADVETSGRDNRPVQKQAEQADAGS